MESQQLSKPPRFRFNPRYKLFIWLCLLLGILTVSVIGLPKYRSYLPFARQPLLLPTQRPLPPPSELLLRQAVEVDRSLVKQLDEAKPRQAAGSAARVEALVFLQKPKGVKRVSGQTQAQRREDRRTFVSSLQQKTEAIQNQVLSTLATAQQAKDLAVKQSYWIDNVLLVELTQAGLERLSQTPGVERIVPNETVTIPPPVKGAAEPTAIEWNIAKIEADKVWNQLGVTGQGVVVADLDTGVNWQHPALKESYRGWNGVSASHAYNWFDAISGQTAPYDDNFFYHGTHTTGTVVGKEGTVNQIGVAPGAKWIAAKFLSAGGSGSYADALEAMEWLLAPYTKPDKSDKDPTKAPDIVSNSWGGSGCSPVLQGAVQAWRNAGILPVFAIGNSGPGSGTTSSPGDLPESVGVGATDNADVVASFSSRGPSCALFGSEIKPEVSAPGVNVRSSSGNSGYAVLSGTSMATPHVAGTAALLLSAKPDMSVDQVEKVLKSTALDLGDPGPDNAYGAGRINAFKAVTAILNSGKLKGTVVNKSTLQPIAGAKVSATLTGVTPPAVYETTTDASGVFFYTYLPVGNYKVSVSAFGFASQGVPVNIEKDKESVISVALNPLPTYTVSGRVTDAKNSPLSAKLELLETPLPPVTTQPDGTYKLSGVPPGTYSLKVTALGYFSQTQTVTIQGNTVKNFMLEAAPKLPLKQDFESGLAGWTTTGLWHVERTPAPCANSYEGSSSAYFGQYNNGACNYHTGQTVSGELTSGYFYIPQTSFDVALTFQGWYQTESMASLYDKRLIEVREEGASNWTLVQQLTSDPMQTWNPYKILLNQYKGKIVQLRFKFDSFDAYLNQYKGWYVDAIQIGVLVPDLAVTQTGPATAVAGQEVTYEVTYENRGLLAAQNVVLTDSWTTPGSEAASTLIAVRGAEQSVQMQGSGGFTIPLGTLNSGQKGKLTVLLKVSENAKRTQVVTNKVTLTSDPADDNPNNNVSHFRTTIISTEIKVTGKAVNLPRGGISHNIQVTNIGELPAANVRATVTISSTVPWSLAATSGGALEAATDQTGSLRFSFGTLNAGESAGITFTVVPKKSLPSPYISGLLTVTTEALTSSKESNLGNNKLILKSKFSPTPAPTGSPAKP